MVELLFLMSSICLTLFSGGTDCSYDIIIVDNDTLVEQYQRHGGMMDFNVEGNHLYAFASSNTRTMWFDSEMLNGEDIDSHVRHEMKHAICHLEFLKTDGVNHPRCVGHFEH